MEYIPAFIIIINLRQLLNLYWSFVLDIHIYNYILVICVGLLVGLVLASTWVDTKTNIPLLFLFALMLKYVIGICLDIWCYV